MSKSYYNENDPKTAKWLKQLIDQNLIADGDVDERDIRDVKAEEIRGYTQYHFFGGIGGWSLALRQAGWEDSRPVITGSCPCQPFSSAGAKKGKKDERHLWPEMLRLIKGITDSANHPTIFGEQVVGATKSWFHDVQADLERENYATGMVVFPACFVGAPHLRQRIYWFSTSTLEYTGSNGRSERAYENQHNGDGNGGQEIPNDRNDIRTDVGSAESIDGMANNNGIGCEGVSRSGATENERIAKLCETDGMANGSGLRPEKLTENDNRQTKMDESKRPTAHSTHDVGCSDSGRLEDRMGNTKHDGHIACAEQRGDDSDDNQTSARKNCSGKSQGASTSRVVPSNDDSKRDRNAPPGTGPTNGFWENPDWLWCQDQKWRCIESGVEPLVDGVPNRMVKLRGYGNAIVVPQAKEFIRSYMESVDR